MNKTSYNRMDKVLDLCLEDEMSHDLLNEWLDHCVEMVQKFMAEAEIEFSPVLFVLVAQGDAHIMCVVQLPPDFASNSIKKQASVYAAGVACVEATKLHPLAVFLATEICKAPHHTGEGERLRPSQHPDHTEHILVLGATPAGAVNLAELDITGRDEQGRLLLASPRYVYAPAPAEISAPLLSPFWKGVEAGLVKLATAQGQPIA